MCVNGRVIIHCLVAKTKLGFRDRPCQPAKSTTTSFTRRFGCAEDFFPLFGLATIRGFFEQFVETTAYLLPATICTDCLWQVKIEAAWGE